MANNTALRAGKDTTRTITFKSKEHEKFYYTYLPKCRYQDVYHKALVYCLGIDRDTRENAEQIYNFKTGYVKTECLHEGWQTSGSVRIIRLAFNLYCDGTPSVYDYEGDAYGKEITVEFCDFERPEIRFSSVNELKKQVAKDLRYGKDYFKASKEI